MFVSKNRFILIAQEHLKEARVQIECNTSELEDIKLQVSNTSRSITVLEYLNG